MDRIAYRQINLSDLIGESDVAPLLKIFQENNWEIDEAKLREIAAGNDSANHWKDLITDYFNGGKKRPVKEVQKTDKQPDKKRV